MAKLAPLWPTEMREITDGVFAHMQATGGFCIANAGLIVGPDGAIDQPSDPRQLTRDLVGRT